MASGCGSCTLCCTVMKVDMDPPKDWHSPCVHCSKAGCAIYSDRPEPCQVFDCLWLASQYLPVPSLDAAFRPDRSGVVMEINNVGTLIAHCHRPQAWRREPLRAWLLKMARRSTVMIDAGGEGTMLLYGDGSTRSLTKIGVDPATNNAIYAATDELPANWAELA